MSDTEGTEYQQKIHGQFAEEIADVRRQIDGVQAWVERTYDTMRDLLVEIQLQRERSDDIARCAKDLADLLWYERGCTQRLRAEIERYKMLVDESPEARSERRDRETPPHGRTKA